MIPTVHAINLVEPERHRKRGIEMRPRLHGGAGFHVNGTALGPVLHRRRMVINALDGQRAMRHPMLASRLRNGDVHHEHVGAFQNGRRRPGVGLTRRNGIHGECSFDAKDAVGDIAGEPSVNAVAVEENGVGFRSRHRRRSGRNRVRSMEGLEFLGSLALGLRSSLVALVGSLVALVGRLVARLVARIVARIVAFVGLAFVACRHGGLGSRCRSSRGRRGHRGGRGRRGGDNGSVGLGGGGHGENEQGNARGCLFSLTL